MHIEHAVTADQSRRSLSLSLYTRQSSLFASFVLSAAAAALTLTLICILLSARVYELIKAKILKFSLFFASSPFSSSSSSPSFSLLSIVFWRKPFLVLRYRASAANQALFQAGGAVFFYRTPPSVAVSSAPLSAKQSTERAHTHTHTRLLRLVALNCTARQWLVSQWRHRLISFDSSTAIALSITSTDILILTSKLLIQHSVNHSLACTSAVPSAVAEARTTAARLDLKFFASLAFPKSASEYYQA